MISARMEWLASCVVVVFVFTLTVPAGVLHRQTGMLSLCAAFANEPEVIPIPEFSSYRLMDWEAARKLRENPISREEHMREAVLRNEPGLQDWIVLATQEQVGWHEYSNLVPGNFDDDPQHELLFQLFEGDKLFKLNGEILSYDPPVDSSLGLDMIYDYDGDERTDFLVETEESVNSIEDSDYYEFNVYNFRSELIGNLKLSHGQFWQQVVADFDGDSIDDHNAVLIRRKNSPAEAVPSDSLMIEITQQEDQHYLINCTGDIDGDGKDELIVSRSRLNSESPGHELLAFGIGNQVTLLEPPAGKFATTPYFCCDLNSDGTDELLAFGGCIDVVNQSVARMEWPYTPEFPYMDSEDAVEIEINGVSYVVGTPNVIDLQAVSVAIWAYDGKLVYYRQFGEFIQDMRKVRYEGRDRLLVLTATRLMMSP